MSREIKFKSYVKHADGTMESFIWEPFVSDDQGRVLKPGESVIAYALQYTGLKDKNGKEIYEGDIVKFNASYIKPCVVYWNDEMTGFYPLISERAAHLEIIGNIYEHPEFLI